MSMNTEAFVIQVKKEITAQLARFRKSVGDTYGERKLRGLDTAEEVESILWHRKVKKMVAKATATIPKRRYFEGQPILSVELMGVSFDCDQISTQTAHIAARTIIFKVINRK